MSGKHRNKFARGLDQRAAKRIGEKQEKESPCNFAKKSAKEEESRKEEKTSEGKRSVKGGDN